MTMDMYGHLFPEQNLQLVKRPDEDVREIRRVLATEA